jgi:hypothetical protein
MVRVTTKQHPRPVEYDPEIRVEFVEGGGGPVSSVTWSSEGLLRALRAVFACKPDEQVNAIEVTAVGIRAEIGMKR